MSQTSAAIPALVLRRTYKTTPEREQFAGFESRERHQNGWTLILDQLWGVAL